MSTAVFYLAAGIQQGWQATRAGLVAGEPRAGQPVFAIVDYADETQLPASIPLLRGPDNARLRARRLEREFPGIALRSMLPVQQRPRDGESDVVMIAVGAGPELDDRLAALGARHALRGVHTPAMLAAAWVRATKTAPQRVLVVMPTPAGLRQVFIDRGQPLLTRLTAPIKTGGTPVELARTIQYLQNTQRIERGAPLELWFWGVDMKDMIRCLPSNVPYQLGTAPVVDGLPDPASGGFQALLELASHGRLGLQLAPDAMRRGWHARMAWRVAGRVAAGIVTAGLLSAGMVLWHAQGVAAQAAASRARSQAITASQTQLELELARQGIDIEDVRLLPDAESTLHDTETGIEEMFDVVGRAFGQRRDIRLQSVEFFSAPPVPPVEHVDRTCGNEPLPAIATAQVDFTLDDDIDVRRRAESLAFLRRTLTQLQPWRSTQESAAVGERDPLTVQARGAGKAGTSEWTTCLLRGSES